MRQRGRENKKEVLERKDNKDFNASQENEAAICS